MILFDDDAWYGLLPLTFTRPCADLRIGITTLREKWVHALSENAQVLTAPYLRAKFGAENADAGNNNLYINATVLPTPELVAQIRQLKGGEAIANDKHVIALLAHSDTTLEYEQCIAKDFAHALSRIYKIIRPQSYKKIQYWWHIFSLNNYALCLDFDTLTQNRQSQPLSSTNILIGNADRIFLEEGAQVEAAMLNVTQAPIYVGKDAEIMEGSMVRGGLALGEHATLKMGAKVYGAVTIGQHSKVGGEINNSVILGYSNKGHDGFMGNSVLGEWCNWGADSNNSNLKNNYSEVSVWDYANQQYQATGLQFCGMVMGDHAKCAINTMFNTGTTVGVCANIFGGDFPPKHIPSFTWGGAAGLESYNLEKAIATAQRVYERRNQVFTAQDRAIFETVLKLSAAL
jgi:UDP-N-acetylglucosamine diphosphorylase/glucosamine-1-phosphate N-acetyltransferase